MSFPLSDKNLSWPWASLVSFHTCQKYKSSPYSCNVRIMQYNLCQCQPVSLSFRQSVDQSVSQSVSVSQSFRQSVSLSISSLSVGQSFSELVDLVSQSSFSGLVIQSVSQSVRPSVSQSVRFLVSQSVKFFLKLLFCNTLALLTIQYGHYLQATATYSTI